jgi:hypothetical protein
MSDKSILQELMAARHNPIGMFHRDTVTLRVERILNRFVGGLTKGIIPV